MLTVVIRVVIIIVNFYWVFTMCQPLSVILAVPYGERWWMFFILGHPDSLSLAIDNSAQIPIFPQGYPRCFWGKRSHSDLLISPCRLKPISKAQLQWLVRVDHVTYVGPIRWQEKFPRGFWVFYENAWRVIVFVLKRNVEAWKLLRGVSLG